MKVAVKCLVLVVGFIAAYYSLKTTGAGAGFTAAGAFIAFAMLEIHDLKIINEETETRNEN